jgi:hypothetical protein
VREAAHTCIPHRTDQKSGTNKRHKVPFAKVAVTEGSIFLVCPSCSRIRCSLHDFYEESPPARAVCFTATAVTIPRAASLLNSFDKQKHIHVLLITLAQPLEVRKQRRPCFSLASATCTAPGWMQVIVRLSPGLVHLRPRNRWPGRCLPFTGRLPNDKPRVSDIKVAAVH